MEWGGVVVEGGGRGGRPFARRVFWEGGVYCFKQTSQTAGPWRVTHSTTPQRKEGDKLECEQRPNVTRFNNWKTSFRREVVTSSTHPRQNTDWLAEIDQSTTTQELDDVGSVSAAPG